MKAASTIQDDIPPVHVLEAAQNQDRKETEDLLAGFDRPGRGPKPSAPERDFVDYYAKKKSGGPDSGSGRAPSSRPPLAATSPRMKQADVSTVVKPRKRQGMPVWLGWVAAAALLTTIGGVVAYLATSDSPRADSGVPTGPSAATTITAATPVPNSAYDNIPPPAPADPSATTTSVTVVEPAPQTPQTTTTSSTKPSGRRDPRNGATPGSSAGANGSRGPGADDSKPPPRDDYMRDL